MLTSTERLDATISSKHSDYGSTTLKNRAPTTNGQESTAEIHIATDAAALVSCEKNSDHINSDQSTEHYHSSDSAAASGSDRAYQSRSNPLTTYTSSLFAAASSVSSPSRFQTRQSRYPRYAYSKMDSYIDEKSTAPKSFWKTARFLRFETFLFILNQMCIGFVTIYMSWLCITKGLQKTPLHAWLVTLGYSLLMAEAVMIHYNANPLTSHYKRHEKHTIHWVLQLAGGGLGMGGTLYKCIQKGFLLSSTHGKLGFASFIFCLVSWLSGLTALYQLKMKGCVRPLFNRTFHNLIGLTCFVLALLAQFYGYQTGFFIRAHPDGSTLPICMKTITLISLVLSCIGPIKALLQKIRIIVRD
ncbi:uncharacterized protein LOC109579963 [Bactrocera dorsalis]|uniref:ascorbate ferrireductase (transmembrane) n=1 Tax=Bactrocera dorsalis TaxID=27457 RepID=A0ABM3K7D2_BACDO|nr:uncharacterized protein LOC109579963 [Bactrocera dorsalis]XP_049317382.1 uncharacterized protein LOC109579963 [Bactrocera dorsalis]XP_049317383.1 uncharacterized protein LOC109579963 [Bactrocera dorsalis]XP_049317384.1 uncharacterized protein LOC109579963 [Bactrocera dorsalis]